MPFVRILLPIKRLHLLDDLIRVSLSEVRKFYEQSGRHEDKILCYYVCRLHGWSKSLKLRFSESACTICHYLIIKAHLYCIHTRISYNFVIIYHTIGLH